MIISEIAYNIVLFSGFDDNFSTFSTDFIYYNQLLWIVMGIEGFHQFLSELCCAE